MKIVTIDSRMLRQLTLRESEAIMWIPKWERDQKNGVDSPVPTQAVSNEEFCRVPQTKQQRQWERLIAELSEEKSKN